MKFLIMLLVVLGGSKAYSQEKFFIGTIHQGWPNTSDVISRKRGSVVEVSVSHVIEWDEDSQVDEVKKVIPGLTLKKRALVYKGRQIGYLKFSDNAKLAKTLNENEAYIDIVKEKYCTDDIDGDCISAATRYHVYFVVY